MNVVSNAPPSAVSAPPLAFRRERLAGGASAAASLGGRLLGDAAGALQARLLAPAGAVFDGWGGASLQRGQHGCVAWASDGHWLHGTAEIDDTGPGLEAAAHRAYLDVFEVLAGSACPHLLRLWNYLADINAEVDGSERYKQFNAGRQRAFVEARRSAFEGAPAACALGTRSGSLIVQFLAGRTPPLAIENPRQVSAYRYPDTYGPRSPSFSRAALADTGGGCRVLFISGTASIVGHATVHAGDVRRQTGESLLNIETLCRVAAESTGAAVAMGELVFTVYVRHAADLASVREVFEQTVGAESRAAREAVWLQADICRADLLVEFEAHGFATQVSNP